MEKETIFTSDNFAVEKNKNGELLFFVNDFSGGYANVTQEQVRELYQDLGRYIFKVGGI